MQNRMELHFSSCPQNESFARVAIAAFAVQLNPTLPEMADIKTAVSEAVTNCIVHAYPGGVGLVHMSVALYDGGKIKITITDKGVGIADVEKAMQPMFTTGNPEERAGLGFAVMQSFMDKVKVTSKPGQGTRVVMTKTLAGRG